MVRSPFILEWNEKAQNKETNKQANKQLLEKFDVNYKRLNKINFVFLLKCRYFGLYISKFTSLTTLLKFDFSKGHARLTYQL